MAVHIPCITLNDGIQHPLIGYGTYKVGFIPGSASSAGGVTTSVTDPAEIQQIFVNAIETGYRFFDCAQFYGNEKIFGDGLKASGIPRDQLFLASKVWTDKIYAGREAIRAQVQQTLSDLQTDYLDLYLLHWPVPIKHVEAWKVLEELKKEGIIKSIGISNYTIEDYLELKPHITVKPTINQIEVNPFLYRPKTIKFFQDEGIHIQAYRVLKQGQEMNNNIILDIAKNYKKTPAQILGRWCVQKKIIWIAKTVTKSRMIENLQIFDFELSPQDEKQLDALTTQQNLDAFKALYQKCVIRDTPLKEGVKTEITVD